MIKLKSPYNGKGSILEADTVLSLPADVEKNMVVSGNAEYYKPEASVENSKAENPYAEKNAKEMEDIVQGINDVEELEALLAYEEQNKKRKTVIEAINERMAELGKEGKEGGKQPEGNEDPEGGKGSEETSNQNLNQE